MAFDLLELSAGPETSADPGEIDHLLLAAYSRGGHFRPERVDVRINQMLGRQALISSGANLHPHPATTRFQNCYEAEIKLGYGHHLEFEERKAHLQAIKKDEHICAVYGFGNNIIVGIRLSKIPDTGLGNVHYTLPPGTRLILNIQTFAYAEGEIEAEGVTVDPEVNLSPPADIHVLVTGKEAEKLVALDLLRPENGMCKDLVVEIQPGINDTAIKVQIDAIHDTYDPKAPGGPKGALCDLLLFDGQPRETTNPWTGFKEQDEGTQAFCDLMIAEQWTPTQNHLLDMSQNMTLRTSICAGGAGSGKTTALIAKTHAINVAGDKVLIVSNSNAALDNICKRLVERYPNDEPPVRAYAGSLPASGLAPSGTAEDDPDDLSEEDLVPYHIVQAKREEAFDSRFAMADYSIEGHIQKHIKKGTVYMVRFIKYETESGESVRDDTRPEPVNAFLFLSDCINRIVDSREASLHTMPARPKLQLGSGVDLNTVSSSDAKDNAQDDPANIHNGGQSRRPATKARNEPLFNEDEYRQMDQAYVACRKYVLRHAKTVLSTAVNCGNDELRRHFAAGTKDRVWLEVDEAHGIPEASMLVPLGGCYSTWGKKIVSTTMYGDPKQPGPTIFGSDGKEGRPQYNEFQAQIKLSLFLRLILSGFPVVELREQVRMHPVLWQEADRIFYKEGSKSAKDLTRFELIPGFEDMVRKLFDYPAGITLNEAHLRLAYFEVRGNTTRRSKDTGSRTNLANYRVVMRLITGPLHELYGDRMFDTVALIVPYQRQRQLYATAFHQLRHQGWTTNELPFLRVIDGLAGAERDHVILDYVVSSSTDGGLGFLTDDTRTCVAHTRARKAMWIVGSDFADSTTEKRVRTDRFGSEMAHSVLVEYRNICVRAGVVLPQDIADIHPTEWPMDMWDKHLRRAYDTTAKQSDVRLKAGGFVDLMANQRARIVAEAARLRREEQSRNLA